MPRKFLAAMAVTAMLVAACGNRGDDDADSATTTPATDAPEPTTAPEETTAPAETTAPDGTTAPTEPTETTEPVPEGPMFGDMPSPCGPAGPEGAPTVADGQNGGDTLRIGTATDHGYEASPGLTIEMLDAAEAFAGWCNAQGGIRGLPIEIVDLDGKLFNVPAAIEQACADVFAMVGGGWVFDDQMFPRFHECGMISFAGYTVTPTAADANGKVQPIPNPSVVKPTTWLLWAKENYAEAIANTTIMYGDFLTTKIVADTLEATMNEVGGFTVNARTPYSPTGEANWVPFAQKLKDDATSALFYVGSEANLVLLYKAMREVGYVPELVLTDANFYSEIMVAEGNADATQGLRSRTAYAPFEEADDFPGMASYLDMMGEFNADGKVAGLGLQATSAYLTFVTAANACLDANDNVLERECVLAAGKQITSWTAGGLHTETNPGENEPPECGIIMGVEGDAWTRIFPEVGSADDNGDGWHCDDPGAVQITGDFGDTSAGIDPSRPN
jgi:ABC-type branched-subunit amino acid transport system substrate-binding protein